MNHEAIKKQLFALYDGELDEAMRREIETHLAACPECQKVYQGWTKTAKALFRAPKPQISEFFVRRVMERIHEIEAPKPQVRWGLFPRPLGWLVPAAVLAMMLFAVVPVPPQALSLDALLLQDVNGTSWVFSNKTLTQDETLQWVMEEPQ